MKLNDFDDLRKLTQNLIVCVSVSAVMFYFIAGTIIGMISNWKPLRCRAV